uniref:WLGC domain-containing protein n=1 Tax=Globisporangium ultimum (strain ATCC 200006 / CBS 805.95 / DAOM BR144) TaxID=431595 RepID=K3WF74_GLOUD
MQITFLHQHTETLPTWMNECTQLEYLYVPSFDAVDIMDLCALCRSTNASRLPRHAEGKDESSLLSLLDNMFEKMHSHVHSSPSPVAFSQASVFQGLTNLRSLTLASVPFVQDLSRFDDLVKLEQPVLFAVPELDSVPDMSPMRKLESFIINPRGYLFGNGFLGSKLCLAENRTDKIASAATREIFSNFSSTVCHASPDGINSPLNEVSAKKCNGAMHHPYELSGNRTGMCYNTRFKAIYCNGNPELIAMRKRQSKSELATCVTQLTKRDSDAQKEDRNEDDFFILQANRK